MSITKKSDVKNHLSARHRTEIHLYRPVSQPDATGFSLAEPGTIEPVPSGFAEDFVAEHSSSDIALEPAHQSTHPVAPQAPEVSRSART